MSHYCLSSEFENNGKNLESLKNELGNLDKQIQISEHKNQKKKNQNLKSKLYVIRKKISLLERLIGRSVVIETICVDKEYECLNGIIGMNRDILMKLFGLFRKDPFSSVRKIRSIVGIGKVLFLWTKQPIFKFIRGFFRNSLIERKIVMNIPRQDIFSRIFEFSGSQWFLSFYPLPENYFRLRLDCKSWGSKRANKVCAKMSLVNRNNSLDKPSCLVVEDNGCKYSEISYWLNKDICDRFIEDGNLLVKVEAYVILNSKELMTGSNERGCVLYDVGNSVYFGQIRNGNREGHGELWTRYRLSDYKLTYSGEWKKDKRVGRKTGVVKK